MPRIIRRSRARVRERPSDSVGRKKKTRLPSDDANGTDRPRTKKRGRRSTIARSASGGERKYPHWSHFAPTFLLLLGLTGIFVADCLTPARQGSLGEEVREEKVVYNVRFDDADDQPAKLVNFKIDDEPDERATIGPVTVEIQDEPEERAL